MKSMSLFLVLLNIGSGATAVAQTNPSFLLKKNPNYVQNEFDSEAVKAANIVIHKSVRGCIEAVEKNNRGDFRVYSIAKVNEGELVYEIEGATLIGGDASTGSALIEVYKVAKSHGYSIECKVK